jgi:hypothetical protein
MNKDTLKGLGLTDEQVEKVWGEFDGKYIPKHRFDEINGELKNAKDAVKERDGQLETLKKSTENIDGLKNQITELQADNAKKDKVHTAEMKRLKREALDDRLLRDAKAIDPLAVKPFLAPIDDNTDDEGYKAVRLQQIDALTKTESKKFLFQAATTAQFTGVKPAESGVPPTTTIAVNPFAPKTIDEAAQVKLFRENPELAKALMKQAGIPVY